MILNGLIMSMNLISCFNCEQAKILQNKLSRSDHISIGCNQAFKCSEFTLKSIVYKKCRIKMDDIILRLVEGDSVNGDKILRNLKCELYMCYLYAYGQIKKNGNLTYAEICPTQMGVDQNSAWSTTLQVTFPMDRFSIRAKFRLGEFSVRSIFRGAIFKWANFRVARSKFR